MLTLVFSLFTVLYAGFVGLIIVGIILSRKGRKEAVDHQGISVIIAARNEAIWLPCLITHLNKLDYPPDKYEVIIVNDHSTDNSMDILMSLELSPQIRVLDFQETEHPYIGKKAALMYGINHSRFNILAFTDADAIPNANWLREINRAMEQNVDYIVGLTLLLDWRKPRIFRLKTFERCVYAALCAGSLWWKRPITSFAGNHAYRKDVFLRSGAFDGIGNIRSGDDDLLLMKLMPQVRDAGFAFSTDMRMLLWDGLDSQARHQTNVRRASKLKYFPLWLQIMSIAIFIYWLLFYCALGIWVFSIATPDVDPIAWTSTIPLMIWIKTAFELLLLSSFLYRIRMLALLVFYPFQVLLFPLQFIYYAVRGTLGSYRWK